MYCSFVFKVCLLIVIDSVTVSHFYNQFLVEETSFHIVVAFSHVCYISYSLFSSLANNSS